MRTTLTETRSGEIKQLLAQRKATQPTNKRTFGSVFKNPSGTVGAGRLIALGLLCEAGTGVGKSLAYLVPALLYRRPVVVSTAPKPESELCR